jgi:hypothetical protein
MPTICAMSRFRAVRIGPHAIVAMERASRPEIYEPADSSVNALPHRVMTRFLTAQ